MYIYIYDICVERHAYVKRERCVLISYFCSSQTYTYTLLHNADQRIVPCRSLWNSSLQSLLAIGARFDVLHLQYIKQDGCNSAMTSPNGWQRLSDNVLSVTWSG